MSQITCKSTITNVIRLILSANPCIHPHLTNLLGTNWFSAMLGLMTSSYHTTKKRVCSLAKSLYLKVRKRNTGTQRTLWNTMFYSICMVKKIQKECMVYCINIYEKRTNKRDLCGGTELVMTSSIYNSLYNKRRM